MHINKGFSFSLNCQKKVITQSSPSLRNFFELENPVKFTKAPSKKYPQSLPSKSLTRFITCFFTLLLLPDISITAHAQDATHKFNRYDSLRGYLNPARSCYKVTFYDLNITVNPDKKEISGSNTIYFKALTDMDSMQVDLFKNMVVDSIFWINEMVNRQIVNSKQKYGIPKNKLVPFKSVKVKVWFRKDSNAIYVHLTNANEDWGRFTVDSISGDTAWTPPFNIAVEGDNNCIQIFYHGHPIEAKRPPWDGGFVWKNDSNGKPWVTVACEGIGASLWWPCKDHLSDKPDSMRITCAMPAGLFCKANGRFRKFRNVPGPDNYISFEWFVSYPINTYDVTLNIGDYTHMKYMYYSKAVDALDLNLYFLQYHTEEAQNHVREVYDMMQCFEKYFGPYPFKNDGYSLVETPYWGMEHQSAIAYGNHFVHTPYGFDFILIHESAHEWFGNSLSCNDQAEMWLHESFATYAEALYVEYSKGYKTSIDYLLSQRPEIVNKEPLIGPRDVNAYDRDDNDIYYKGSWMLHTLRNVLNNDSLWFKILYTYATKNAYATVTTDSFVNLVNRMTGKDLRPFFMQYLTKTQPPRFIYHLEQKGEDVEMIYRIEADVQDFSMPIVIETSKDKMQRLSPINQNQQIILKQAHKDDVKVADWLFYLKTVKE